MHYMSNFVIETGAGVIESFISYDPRSNSYLYIIKNVSKQTVEQKSYGNGVDCIKARDDRVIEMMEETK